MESFRERDGGLSSNRLPGEPLDAEKTCDLEADVKKESVTATSEEIKRAHSEFGTTEILSRAKETARPTKRRRKLRVYIPSYR
jgi:hypothetical protein